MAWNNAKKLAHQDGYLIDSLYRWNTVGIGTLVGTLVMGIGIGRYINSTSSTLYRYLLSLFLVLHVVNLSDSDSDSFTFT